MKFFNISNHPSEHWSTKQINYARQLAAETDGEEHFKMGQIIDIPFPNVSPRATVRKIAFLAFDLLRQLPNQPDDGQGHGGRHAVMVSGEFQLTFMLMDTLIEHGWRVYVATTERTTIDNGDGSKTCSFEFVGFRRICRLSQFDVVE